MQFEWDESKNRLNAKKHGIRFEEAQDIFLYDPLTWADNRGAYGEIREVSIGEIATGLVLIVVHTTRHKKIRLISARKATRVEREKYYGYIS